MPHYVGCNEADVRAHGVNQVLVEQRVRESIQALEAERQALMNVISAATEIREARWNINPLLVRWFGDYSKHGTMMLYSRCQRIMQALGDAKFEIKCAERLGGLLGRGGIGRMVIYAAAFGTHTQVEQIAAIIHETGHPVLAGADFKYYPAKCRDLARRHPAIARVNLDNLAYCALECGGFVVPP